MKLLNREKGLLLACILFISFISYGNTRDSWESRPTYDVIPDSLNKYDKVYIYYKKQIEISYYSRFEITYTLHQKTKVFSRKGLEAYPEFFLPDVTSLENVKARTIKPDGSSIELKRNDIKIIPHEAGEGICKFVVPGANIGDELEILISYTEKNSVQVDDIFFHKDAFTLHSELLIKVTDNIKIEAKGYNKLPVSKVKFVKDKKTYSWELNGLEEIGKKSNIIIHNDLPFLRVALRTLSNHSGVTFPIEFNSWSSYRNEIRFDEYVGHRLSFDKNLGAFVTKHLGSESDNLSRKVRFENLAKTITFINDSLSLFYTQDSTELKKLLGDHLKEKRLPVGSINDLYSVLLDMTYFEYYLCLGRNRYLGDIDPQFVSRNQITDVFFVFTFEDKYHYIFPKTHFNTYDLGEIPNQLEGSKVIVFPRRGATPGTNVLTLPITKKANNSKTINTFAYVNTKENSIYERSKLITTGAWTSIYRNGYKNLRKDSMESSDIYKFMFNTSEDLIDSLSIEKDEHFFPFVFSLKFNKTEKNNLIALSDSLKVISFNRILSHFLPDSYADENDYAKIPISFLFSDNIKYYLMFDKQVKIAGSEIENIFVENEFGIFDLQVKQLNPNTIFIFSRLVFNKSNLNSLDSSPLYVLGNKIKDARTINLSFKIIE